MLRRRQVFVTQPAKRREQKLQRRAQNRPMRLPQRRKRIAVRAFRRLQKMLAFAAQKIILQCHAFRKARNRLRELRIDFL